MLNANMAPMALDACSAAEFIHQVFETCVRNAPHSIALVYEGMQLTYEELNARANRLARHLRAQGVSEDKLVALYLDRGFELVIAMLGVLKSGGAYVPLDPNYPTGRIEFMLTDCAPVLVLTQQRLLEQVPGGLPQIALDALDITHLESTNLEPAAIGLALNHLAYVNYTSGSTGLPKGVMIEHRGTSNFAQAQREVLVVNATSRMLQFASPSFDACSAEVFVALSSGAALIMAPRDRLLPGKPLLALLQAERVTHLTLPPAIASVITPQEVPDLQTLLVAGEACSAAIVQTWAPTKRLINAYGATETTICATLYQCDAREEGPPSVGHAMRNYVIRILDARQQPVPVGVSGEIYIGGLALARGYLNRAELTAACFIKDPFDPNPSARLYRTGDFGRWKRNGDIDYIGRQDAQVKIRGFRIELGEIEGQLARCVGVRDAVAVALADPDGEKRLVAYYTKAQAQPISVNALREELLDRLPEHMIPVAFVAMDSFPLTPNGKVDRKALPFPHQAAVASKTFEAPQGPFEETLARIWCDLLQVSQVGRQDDFFDLGGHSLMVVKLVSRIRQHLSREIALRDVFLLRTLQALASVLSGASPSELPAIITVDRSEPLPLSFAQQRLWFLCQLRGASAAYHVPLGVRLRGHLDQTALKAALQAILARHEALRTTFCLIEGEPKQILGGVKQAFDLREQDLSSQPNPEVECTQLIKEEADRPFDLTHGPLIRGQLIRLAAEDHVLLVSMHHIVSDGWSMTVLMREFSEFYRTLTRHEPLSEPALMLQYADYAVWQRRWLGHKSLEQQAEYWRKTLSGVPSSLDLPTDRPRPDVQSFAGAHLVIVVPRSLLKRLKVLSQRRGTTLFATLLAAWAAVFCRLSGQSEVVIGSPVANRNRLELEGLIGFFVNTLALRIKVADCVTGTQLLEHVQSQVIGAQSHQDIPFEHVVDLVKPNRSLGHNPLFQVLFAWQSATEGMVSLPGLTVDRVHAQETHTQFDLSISLGEVGEEICGSINYATELYERDTVERFVGYWQTFMRALIDDEELNIRDVPLLKEDERQKVLVGFNGLEESYADKRMVHEIFEGNALSQPRTTALIYEDRTLSYAELNHRANQLAHRLIELAVKPDDRVAICVERGFEMVIGVLGVLKAGGAYLPLDPTYPRERLNYALRDSAPKVLLIQAHLRALLPDVEMPTIYLDANEALTPAGGTNPDSRERGLSDKNLAYVIYTSGSTGLPKGVMVEHHSVARLLHTTKKWFNFNAEDVWTLFHSFAFDFSVWEMWGALAYGGRLVLVPAVCAKVPQEFYALICQERVTVLNQTPSAFRQLIFAQSELEPADSPPGHQLRYVIFGGEALQFQSLAPWARHNDPKRTQLVNMYGITEITVHATYRVIRQADIETGVGSLIGAALPDLRAYLLDTSHQPVPIGVTGEIYIAGPGVARGYLNRPELTAERFLSDPFSARKSSRMYKSGDLGRWHADGSLEYVGRNDFQVKIRGFRIELGEIEAQLSQYPGIREAVVVAAPAADGEQRLVAYYTRSQNLTLASRALREALLARLPEHMIPVAFVSLESLPLTANGKIDHKALPLPDQVAIAAKSYVAPESRLEKGLARIWQKLLQLNRIGRHDDFFDLGGHSLLAVKLVSRIHQELNLEATLRDIFERPTLQALADRLSAAARSALPAIERVDRAAPLPLSFAQQRLWFLSRLERTSTAYHIPVGVRLRGPLNKDALKEALRLIRDRHEALRTTFHIIEGSLVQVIGATGEQFSLVETDLQPLPDAQAECDRLIGEEAIHPFDLERGPLIRGLLMRLSADDHALIVNMHHIVSDGWSMGLLMREFSTLYLASSRVEGGSVLPSLAVQYGDFAVWQRRWLSGEVLAHQASYWRKTLADAPVALNLPVDHARSEAPTLQAANLEIRLSAVLAADIKALAQREGATVFMILLAAWSAVFSRLSGQTDLVIGSPVANRNHIDTEGIIGFFVNTLALRIELGAEQTVAQLLDRVKRVVLGAQHHQDIPFEQVVELVKPARSLGRSPIFQVLFASQNAVDGVVDLPGIAVDNIQIPPVHIPFELSISLGERKDGIMGSVSYALDLYEKKTIERFIGYFQTLLEAMVRDPSCIVDQLPMMSYAERCRLLGEFNTTDFVDTDAQSIHSLIETRADQQPDAVALEHEGEQISYRELNERANRLAHHLKRLSVIPDDRVAICLERGIDMIVALLATLKAGAAYVPLDPVNPPERLRYLLLDSTPSVLLTHTCYKDTLMGQSDALSRSRMLFLDQDIFQSHLNQLSCDNPPRSAAAQNLAYIIYTSGSTGRPKGVMVEHAQILNTVVALHSRYAMSSTDRLLQFVAFGFDVAAQEIFVALTAGATLVLRNERWIADPRTFWRLCDEHRITILHLPAAYWNQLSFAEATEVPVALRLIAIGGDQLDAHRTGCWLNAREGISPMLLNEYGPTETAVTATSFTLASPLAVCVPIGQPLSGVRVYVLDRFEQPVPIGVTGELYIGGAGVARGYLNNPVLTQSRFLPDPFAPEPAGRMYRSGDFGRWSAAGQLEFVGRTDNQVKIRGFRLELGEIEAALLSVAGVQEAAVIVQSSVDGEKRLVAYLSCAMTNERPSFRAELLKRLPDFMAPSLFVTLNELPKTASGKIDRRALAALETEPVSPSAHVSPDGAAENAVAIIWCELLGLSQVSRFDNFFDLGGHSLLAVQLIERLRELGLQSDIRAVFICPDLATFAAALHAIKLDEFEAPPNRIPAGASTITPAMISLISLNDQQIDRIVAQVPGGAANIQDIYPLAPLQEGILFHHLYNETVDSYIRILLLEVTHVQELRHLLSVFEQLVKRHDVLRTAVFWEGLPQPLQVVLRQTNIRVKQISLVSQDPIAQLKAHMHLPALQTMDLHQAPLLRIFWAQDLDEPRCFLLLQLHHLVVDNRSMQLLVQEAMTYSNQEKPAIDAVPYRQFVAHALHKSRVLDSKAFFSSKLSSVNHPTAPFGINDLRSDGSASIEVRSALGAELARNIRKLSRQLRLSNAAVFHATWAALLSALVCKPDVVFGTVLSGRLQNMRAADRIVGMHINTLPLRLVVGSQTAAQLIKETHTEILELLEHEHAPLSEALRCTNLPPDQALFSTIVNYRQSTVESTALVRVIEAYDRTNFPLALTVDDVNTDFGVTLVMDGRISQKLMTVFVTALEILVEASLGGDETSLEELLSQKLGDLVKDLLARSKAEGEDSASPVAKMEMFPIAAESESPRGQVERDLAAIWSELLSEPRVYRQDNFFELGGYSLLALKLVTQVREILRLDLKLRDVYESPTLEALAARLKRASPLESTVMIPRADRSRPLPLSFAQQRLWFLAAMPEANLAYVIPVALRLRGALDVGALAESLRLLVVRHEILRTTFKSLQGTAAQIIASPDQTKFSMVVYDLSAAATPGELLEEHLKIETTTPFNLEAGPLIRGQLLRTAKDAHVLLISMHHIISDGASMQILARELFSLYNAVIFDSLPRLSAVSRQYADYASWQRQWLDGTAIESHLDFWRQELKDAPALISLPTDHPRPPRMNYVGANVKFAIDQKLLNCVQALSSRHGVTLFTTLLSIWAVLLTRLAGAPEVVVGIPATNRDRRELEPMIGLFVNTLAVRLRIEAERGVPDLLNQVKSRLVAAQSHAQLPFERVVDVVKPKRSLAHSPIFQVMFSWHGRSEAQVPMQMAGLVIDPVPTPGYTAQVDLALTLRERETGIDGTVTYATSLYTCTTVKLIVSYFIALLKDLVREEASAVAQLSMQAEAPEREIDSRAKNLKSPRDYVYELFEKQVRKTPEATAIIYGEQALSYRELNSRANRIARQLRVLGVKSDRPVALLVDRGVDFLVGILGVLKAGGCYVPLDVDYPRERVAYILKDSAPAAVLTTRALAHRLVDHSTCILRLDDEITTALAEVPNLEALPDRAPSDLAYILYTSGTTGAPKGVSIEQSSLVAFWADWSKTIMAQFSSPVTIALNAPLMFDPSVFDWLQILSGHRIAPVPQEVRLDAEALSAFFERFEVQCIIFTPTHFDRLLAAGLFKPGAYRPAVVQIGGEAISPATWELLRQSTSTRFYNVYGPTECTVQVTAALINGAGSDPHIGKVQSSAEIRFLDSLGRAVPVGVVGELHIGGPLVGRGYWNNPKLTAERFIQLQDGSGHTNRFFKTGDLGRFRSDGNIDCLGRNDHQIKIRGYRIELMEIEATLRQLPKISDAVVVPYDHVSGEKRLAAYFVQTNLGELSEATIRDHLRAQLPLYMLPAALMELPSMPMSVSGKLERSALPPVTSEYSAQSAQESLNDREATVAAIWRRLLNLSRVNAHDNFFDLGGHSLLVLSMLEGLAKTGYEANVRTIFDFPTLSEFTREITRRDASMDAASEGFVKLRSAASGPSLFLLHDITGEVIHYRELVQALAHEGSVYGLTFDADSLEPGFTIEALAKKHLLTVRRIQPKGPYRLAGFSMGGLLAFEIAARLRLAGDTVGFLGMVDSFTPARVSLLNPPLKALSDGALLIDYARSQGARIEETSLSHLMALSDLREVFQACQRAGVISTQVNEDSIRRLIFTARVLDEAVRRYDPVTIDVVVHYFAAQTNPCTSTGGGWMGYVTPRMLIKHIGGTHESILRTHFAQSLGRAMSNAIMPPASEAAQDYEPVLLLQRGTSDLPHVFCIPGAGASVTAFFDVVESLDPRFTVYGLQPRGMAEGQDPYPSIRAAATDYLATVTRVTRGTVRVIGHSMGGLVALEMANQSAQVSAVSLIDTAAPSQQKRDLTDAQISTEFARLFDPDFSETPQFSAHLLYKRLRATQCLPPGHDEASFTTSFKVFKVALQTQRPPQGFCRTPTQLIKAVSAQQEDTAAYLAEWSVYLNAPTLNLVEGTHTSILKAARARSLAANITEFWDGAPE